MLKTLSLLLVFSACLGAQTPSCIQIQDTLYSAGVTGPVPMNGTIDLTLGYSALNGAFVVVQSQARQTITAGIVNTCLVPGIYSALYTVRRPAPMTGSLTFTRYWIVPANSSSTLSWSTLVSSGWTSLTSSQWSTFTP